MIAATPLLIAGGLAAGAAMVSRMREAQRARLVATALSIAPLLLCVATACLVSLRSNAALPVARLGEVDIALLPPGLLMFAPLVTSIVGLVAVALAPIATHPPRTLARVLLLLAIAQAFLAAPHPFTLTVLWVASSFTAWLELRQTAAGARVDRLFLLYHAPSAVLFGVGAMLLHGGALRWLSVAPSTRATAGVVTLLVAIAIREAMIFAHSWFAPFVQRAPMAIVVAFSAPQLGVYAQLELLQNGIVGHLAPSMAVLGALTAVVAAALGVAQLQGRRAFAFLMISQTGLVAFGLETRAPVALTGALLTWQVTALATAGLGMTLAAVAARKGGLSLRVPNGNFERTPRLAVAFLVLGFAAVGFPMTLGFVAEDLLVQSSVDEYPLLALVLIVATALNGITVMRAFFALFTGQRSHAGEVDLTRRETWALSAVMAALLVAGLLPGPLVAKEGQQADAAAVTSNGIELGHQ